MRHETIREITDEMSEEDIKKAIAFLDAGMEGFDHFAEQDQQVEPGASDEEAIADSSAE